jgi:NADH:ubiquinone oxidoreductase subunit 5 (subunit L)/multisubunit Na+/H+ antiporter MnhA subunit
VVKFFGVVFLGQPRDPALHEAHEAGWAERLGMLWLAAGCVLLGLFPAHVIDWLTPVVRLLVGQTMVNDGNWLMLAPVSAERASYAPLIFFAVVGGVLLLTYLWVRRVYHGRVRRSDPWDCGYPEQDARMQDSAEGFGQPIRQIFEAFMQVERETPDPFDRKPSYRGASSTSSGSFYRRSPRVTDWLSQQAGRLQHGRIQWYLIYSFATLIFLLIFTTR